ncbi:Dockerin type I repeat protein [Planctomycetes bacterium CA13]|uniref:Dockerin type I repeat protein n=1 Tax=Novipirellula herctigrandis TaxID=2527986 RepID=A0A5C5YZR6_9BACT|nr:Dockerin type I repeat protein [Planctomycetes bacterium CA13]
MIRRSEPTPSSQSLPSRSRATRKRVKHSKRNRRLMMEGLEQRQLLAGDVSPLTIPTVSASEVFTYDGPRNVGAATEAYIVQEAETAGTFGLNDSINAAQFIPLGNGAGQRSTIDLTGNLSFGSSAPGGIGFQSDIDTYAFDLKAGDILDISTHGVAFSYTVYDESGRVWYGVDDPQIGYSLGSPLQTTGNAVFAQVVPTDGRYYLDVVATTSGSAYTLGLRTYRPTTEKLPVGAKQSIFLDFNGGSFTPDTFNAVAGGDGFTPIGGRVIIPPLQDSLTDFNIEIEDDAAYRELILSVVSQVEKMFSDVAAIGNNGDFATSGIAGEYGIDIFHSEMDIDPINGRPDPGINNPLVTRIIVGGSAADYGFSTVGIAMSIDIGNFDLSEVAILQTDGIAGLATQFPISGSASILDAVARAISIVSVHEAGHLFGMRHTNALNNVGTLTDSGGQLNSNAYGMGVGPDQIFGTVDDTEANFHVDRFTPVEGLLGTQYFPAALTHVLSTGTQGGVALTGKVFSDANRDGSSTGDAGIGGVTVFVDSNNNGVLDAGETRSISASDGTYTLSAASGTVVVSVVAPSQYVATTSTSQTLSTASGGNVSFGFHRVQSDITGTKFLDSNGNGQLDDGEGGIGGVYIYLDLDGDNRPDIGEPASRTADDGTYSINFPGPGTYTIREVLEPGFQQTLPGGVEQEYVVFYDGTALTDNYNFGNQPSQDYGDAPDTYLTTEAVGGPSHGITDGLYLGAGVDREIDGQPTVGADGDDLAGSVIIGGIFDDEDGVRQASPFGLGSTGQFEVTLTNNSGSLAYLQAFMDFDGDGTFSGAGEHFLVDSLVTSQVGSQTRSVNVDVPANAELGDTFVRFRLSQTPGLGVGGFSETGEVEDHRVSVLPTANVANNDDEFVARNSLANQLFPLANDFETAGNELTIETLNQTGTRGTVVVANDRRSVYYTPATNFIGNDSFGYTVVDAFGNRNSAIVNVQVSFLSENLTAVDDTHFFAMNSTQNAVNVLANDLTSTTGGSPVIISTTPGSAGGTITKVGGGQSLYYTPRNGFGGTEEFSYTIQDGNGEISTANVTINILPQSEADDVVEYSIEFLDPINGVPIQSLRLDSNNPSLNRFDVRVSVDELDPNDLRNPEGVAAAFIDLLYDDGLVQTVTSNPGAGFDFDITFGPFFGGFSQGVADTPGLIDEVGSTKDQTPHDGPVELFTITFEATEVGVATFKTNPTEDAQSETLLIGVDEEVPTSQIRLGSNSIEIFPGTGAFVGAIDDGFMNGVDSAGATIAQGVGSTLRVLDNDQFVGQTITEFEAIRGPSEGLVERSTNGTATLNDDFFIYRPFVDAGASGYDEFTYLVVTEGGFATTAEVTIAYGNAAADDEVRIGLALVDDNGNAINGNDLSVGDRFGVQVDLEDLRATPNFVYAGFLDMLYTSNTVAPANTITTDDFNFDVEIGEEFNRDGAVGVAYRPGIIDEFGTFSIKGPNQTGSNPATMAVVYFDVIAPGPINIVGSPADFSPFQDTLLADGATLVVPTDKITYESLSFNVNGPQGELPEHNYLWGEDVNNDGDVSPIDALLIINRLSAENAAAAQGEATAIKHFVDVNGDNAVTAMDALQVINFLTQNDRGVSGQGEQIAAAIPSNGSVATSDEVPSDSVFAELSTSEKVVSVDTSSSQALASVSISDNASTDADDDDDLLDLLADDIAGNWS